MNMDSYQFDTKAIPSFLSATAKKQCWEAAGVMQAAELGRPAFKVLLLSLQVVHP